MAKLSLNKSPQKGMLTNSGTVELSKQRLISSIQTRSPFKELFPINPSTLRAIEESIRGNGYDKSQPLHIWKEKGVLLDGHTRLLASLNNSLKEIPVYEHSFSTEEDALEYAIGLQKNRRNLTDAEMLSCLSQLDQLKKSGRKSASNRAETKGKSAEKTAEILGTSRSKVEKMRSISKHASEEVIDSVKNGKQTINSAYEKLASEKRKDKNPTHDNKILFIKDNCIYLESDRSKDDIEPVVIVNPKLHKSIHKNIDSILKIVVNDLLQII
jgi:ParB family chromosome partitioning protein